MKANIRLMKQCISFQSRHPEMAAQVLTGITSTWWVLYSPEPWMVGNQRWGWVREVAHRNVKGVFN